MVKAEYYDSMVTMVARHFDGSTLAVVIVRHTRTLITKLSISKPTESQATNLCCGELQKRSTGTGLESYRKRPMTSPFMRWFQTSVKASFHAEALGRLTEY